MNSLLDFIVMDCRATLCSARNDNLLITLLLPFFRRVFFLLRKGFSYAYG